MPFKARGSGNYASPCRYLHNVISFQLPPLAVAYALLICWYPFSPTKRLIIENHKSTSRFISSA